MSESNLAPDAEPTYEHVVAKYVDRLNNGEKLDPLDIITEHPAMAEELLEDLGLYIQCCTEESGRTLGTLGDYTLRSQIGRGGMGIVYDAWENSMDRRVALKVLPAGVAADHRAFV